MNIILLTVITMVAFAATILFLASIEAKHQRAENYRKSLIKTAKDHRVEANKFLNLAKYSTEPEQVSYYMEQARVYNALADELERVGK